MNKLEMEMQSRIEQLVEQVKTLTVDNKELERKLKAAEKEVTFLKKENDRLDLEITDLRLDLSLVDRGRRYGFDNYDDLDDLVLH